MNNKQFTERKAMKNPFAKIYSAAVDNGDSLPDNVREEMMKEAIEELTDMLENTKERCGTMNIQSPCPKWGCPPEEIEYLNSGPIVRIRCPKCTYGIQEIEAWEAGYTDPEGLFDYWNQLT